MIGIPEFFNNKMRRAVWDYRNAQGEIIGHVARFQGGKTKEGKIAKEIIPFFKLNGKGFGMGAAIEPRPLFGLDVLVQADPSRAVFICEGEKCAAALHSMGLVAITSQGGSLAAKKAYWKPLEGRGRIYILPDRDEVGEGYAKAVCAILASLENPPDVKIVRLPDLPDAGDVVDWIAMQIKAAGLDWDEFAPVPDTGMDMKRLIAEFQQAVKASGTPALNVKAVTENPADQTDWQAPVSLTTATLPSWPDDVFPDSVQKFVSGLAVSTETPLELPALLVLASIAAATQGKYRVRVKSDYFEPVNIWTCAALPPASRKTAVQNAATAPLTAWERAQREITEPLIKQAIADDATIREKISYLRKQAGKAEGGEFTQLKNEIAKLESELPEIPTMPEVWKQDVTTEHLGTLMGRNSERMAVMSDEAGIFDILAGRYSGGVPNLDLYLQGHAGSPVKVDRGVMVKSGVWLIFSMMRQAASFC